MHICSSSEYSSGSRIPIINNPDEKTIYLVPASYQPSNNMFTEWVYVNNTWEIFGSVAIDLSSYLTDVQIDGTSIVTDGVAEIPIAKYGKYGLFKISNLSGLSVANDGSLSVYRATPTEVKVGTVATHYLSPSLSNYSTFYGLAKVAGYDEKNSALPVGTYSEEAKIAIQKMLGVPSNSDITSLQTVVQSKADTQTVSALADAVQDLDGDVQGLQTTVQAKADTATVTALSGTVSNLSDSAQQYMEYTNSAITNLRDSKASKSYVDGELALKADAQMVTALSGTVTGLQTTKADKSYVDTQLTTKASTATATASADGLMSAQDKSKLDAVYADYTSALAAIGGGS